MTEAIPEAPAPVETVHFFTGPVDRKFTLADGTTYDCAPDHVVVPAHHVQELGYLIGEHHRIVGHPKHVVRDESGVETQVPFVHIHADHPEHPDRDPRFAGHVYDGLRPNPAQEA